MSIIPFWIAKCAPSKVNMKDFLPPRILPLPVVLFAISSPCLPWSTLTEKGWALSCVMCWSSPIGGTVVNSVYKLKNTECVVSSTATCIPYLAMWSACAPSPHLLRHLISKNKNTPLSQSPWDSSVVKPGVGRTGIWKSSTEQRKGEEEELEEEARTEIIWLVWVTFI